MKVTAFKINEKQIKVYLPSVSDEIPYIPAVVCDGLPSKHLIQPFVYLAFLQKFPPTQKNSILIKINFTQNFNFSIYNASHRAS